MVTAPRLRVSIQQHIATIFLFKALFFSTAAKKTGQLLLDNGHLKKQLFAKIVCYSSSCKDSSGGIVSFCFFNFAADGYHISHRRREGGEMCLSTKQVWGHLSLMNDEGKLSNLHILHFMLSFSFF